jgi:thiamine pyrophosphokinase
VPGDEQRPVVVFAGAPLQATPRLRACLEKVPHPYVIAADSGAATALAFGLQPDVVIGDFDSLRESTRIQLQGVPFETYPRAKDATDSQLALEHAVQRQPSELLLLGFLNGPRLDMTVGNVLLLLHAPNAVLVDEHNEGRLVRGGEAHRWTAEHDELISLLPLAANCEGVTTQGLRFPLRAEQLVLGHSRGISNEPVAPEVGVSLTKGVLLIMRHFPRL